EEIGAVGPHLMQVRGDVWPPREKARDAGARFGMRVNEPVAIEIKLVVTGARTGPRPLMRECARNLGDTPAAALAHDVLHVALVAIGVLNGIDERDGAVEQ